MFFPPTDDHTASLVGDHLFIIGRQGYPKVRRYGTTPVFALDLSNYRVSEIQTQGEVPGWIYKHQAEVDAQGVITIRGGKVIRRRNGREQGFLNVEEYALNPSSGSWQRLTNRNWRQFSIRDERGFVIHAGRAIFSIFS